MHSSLGGLLCGLCRCVTEPRLGLELAFDVATQSTFHLRVIELLLPFRHDDRRDAIADEVGERTRFRHKAVDAEDQGQTCDRDGWYRRERRREDDEAAAGHPRSAL